MEVIDVAWSPCGTRIATGGVDNVVFVWDVGPSSGLASRDGGDGSRPLTTMGLLLSQPLATLSAHEGYVCGLAWDPWGSYLLSLGQDRRLVVWRRDDAAGWELGSASATLATGRTGAALASGPGQIATSASASASASDLWSAVTSDEDAAARRAASVVQSARSGAADWTQLRVVDGPFQSYVSENRLRRVSWSPDGAFLAASAGMKDRRFVAPLLERETWSLRVNFTGHSTGVHSVSFSPMTFGTFQSGASRSLAWPTPFPLRVPFFNFPLFLSSSLFSQFRRRIRVPQQQLDRLRAAQSGARTDW